MARSDQSRHFPVTWNLTPAQDRILFLLMQNGEASKRQIADVAARYGRGSLKAVKVHISKLRSTLNTVGVRAEINSICGWGYRCDTRSRVLLLAHTPPSKKEIWAVQQVVQGKAA